MANSALKIIDFYKARNAQGNYGFTILETLLPSYKKKRITLKETLYPPLL
jgi:hypothetical protein